MVIVEDDAVVVRRAFEVFLTTRKGARVRDLLKQHTGKHWDTTKTKRLLTDERYTGVAVFGHCRKEGGMPAFLDRDTYMAALALLRERQPISVSGCGYSSILEGLVQCPYCDGSYTNGAAKGGQVRYYVCHRDNKGLTTCPVKRIHAGALHQAVLRQIAHAAEHHTVMHRLIAESGGWGKPEATLQEDRGALGRKRQQLGMRVANYTEAIGNGKGSEAIYTALAKAEAERAEVEVRIRDLDEQLARATVKRPTAEQVQGVWQDVVRLWALLSEDEQKALAVTWVERVDVVGKNKATLRLRVVPQGCQPSKFALNEQVGAGVGFEPTTSRL